MRKESETPSGIRLMLLLKGHLREIMNRECANQTSIHLYCTGSYWVAFERSADAPVRLSFSGCHGFRNGSFPSFV